VPVQRLVGHSTVSTASDTPSSEIQYIRRFERVQKTRAQGHRVGNVEQRCTWVVASILRVGGALRQVVHGESSSVHR
jgi:hypothetical protein